jgi:hypothetical protein
MLQLPSNKKKACQNHQYATANPVNYDGPSTNIDIALYTLSSSQIIQKDPTVVPLNSSVNEQLLLPPTLPNETAMSKSCSVCNRQFKNEIALVSHVRQCHPVNHIASLNHSATALLGKSVLSSRSKLNVPSINQHTMLTTLSLPDDVQPEPETSTAESQAITSTLSKCCDCNGKNAACRNCKCVKLNKKCSSCYPSRHGRCSNLPLSNQHGNLNSKNGEQQLTNENNSMEWEGNNLNETPSEANMLSSINIFRCPVLKRIPKAARQKCGEVFTMLLENICSNPEDLTQWLKLFIFQFQCLAKPQRGGKGSLATIILKRLECFIQNPFHRQEKTEQCHKTGNSKNERSQEKIKSMVCEKIDDGDIKGAIRTLISTDSIAPNNEETLNTLLNKHPKKPSNRTFQDFLSSENKTIKLTNENIIKALQSFPTGSSGGLDGLRPDHLKEMFLSATDERTKNLLVNSLTKFCNFIINGKNFPATVKPVFFGARLIALLKKDGGIRPIAVGNSLRRLVSKTACQLVQEEAKTYLSPNQLGFGVRSGAETAIHAASHYISTNPTHVILKIDFKNAFNCIHRNVFLKEVSSVCPTIYNYVQESYKSDSILQFIDNNIISEEGVQQGDPLGPLLFCLAIQPIIRKMKSPMNIWYLDDGTLGGDLQTVLSDFHTLLSESANIGLEVNISKCEIFGEHIDQNHLVEHKNLKLLAKHELNLLGSCLNADSLTSTLNKKMEEVSVLLDKLVLLPKHCAFYILKHCFALPKFLFLLRTAPCFLNDTLKSIDDLILTNLSSTLNIKFTEENSKQATLPCSMGGLGVRMPSDIAIPAYLASVSATSELAEQLIPSFSKNDAFKAAKMQWQRKTNKEEPSDPLKQKSWDEALAKTNSQLLLESVSTENQIRLQIISNKNASIWLNALPSTHYGTRLTDEEFRTCICLRLGSAVYERHKCKCGTTIDEYGQHSFSCKRNKGKIIRHQMVNAVLHSSLQKAGVPNTLEPNYLTNSDNRRPDGVTILPWQNGKPATWDFTCAHPLCTSNLNAWENLLDRRELTKKTKYSWLETNYIFFPIAADTFGNYGSSANKFINKVAELLKEKNQDKNAGLFFRQQISFAIQRGNACTILSSLH